MIRIAQKHPRGCGHAVLAMLTEKSYDEIVADFPEIDPNFTGLYGGTLHDYLADHGYAIRLRRQFMRQPSRQREVWPPEPFAPIHYAMVDAVNNPPCSHFVVVLADGRVIDPMFDDRKSLSDYPQVHQVCGVYKV